MMNLQIQKMMVKRGRPKGEISQLKLYQVLQLLPKDGTPKRVKDLKDEARKMKIGFDTLFNYLERLRDNFIVGKFVDTSARPPTVYYKKITPEEMIATKELWIKDLPFIQKTLGEIELPFPITDTLKKVFIEKFMALFLAVTLRIAEKTKEIEDPKRKPEFVSLNSSIYLHPFLMVLSSLPIEPKDWEYAFGIVKEMRQKTDKAFANEIRKLLSKKLSSLFLELHDDFTHGKIEECEKKFRKLKKLVRR